MRIVLVLFITPLTLRGEWGEACFRQESMLAIAVVFGIVGVSTWGATQWAAGALGHQAGLGVAWFTLSGYPVYLPWRLFEWWYAYDAYAPEIFERAGAIAAGGGVSGALFASSELGLARAAEPIGDDLRLRAVGYTQGNRRRGIVWRQRRLSRARRK